MLLHLKFCIEWFELNSKWISKSLENGFEKLEKRKRKGYYFPSSVFSPV
jgi:hypothetical protein